MHKYLEENTCSIKASMWQKWIFWDVWLLLMMILGFIVLVLLVVSRHLDSFIFCHLDIKDHDVKRSWTLLSRPWHFCSPVWFNGLLLKMSNKQKEKNKLKPERSQIRKHMNRFFVMAMGIVLKKVLTNYIVELIEVLDQKTHLEVAI